MSFKIDVDTSAAVKGLAEKNRKIIEALASANIQVAARIEGQVKDSIAGRSDEDESIDSSYMLRSVRGRATATGAEIVGGADYTQYIEYGHTMRNGKWWEGRHHFRNTMQREEGRVKDYYKDKISEALK